MQTGLILRVPEVEPAVDRWRREYDRNARLGVPAHITVLFPWIPFKQITVADLDALTGVVRGVVPIELTFAGFGRFPEVLWLDPQPAAPLRHLTLAVAARWSEFPPYGGEFGGEPVPHLTVADTAHPGQQAKIEADITRHLPITATVRELSLMVFRGERWQLAEAFPLGAQPASGASPASP